MPIYFVQAGFDGPVKIGFANDVPTRMKILQNYHYEPLRLIACYEGLPRDERELHKVFNHLRVIREWFRFDQKMLDLDLPWHCSSQMRSNNGFEVEDKILLAAIEAYLINTGESQTAFGRRIANDTSLMSDLRNGRGIGPRLRRKIEAALVTTKKTKASELP